MDEPSISRLTTCENKPGLNVEGFTSNGNYPGTFEQLSVSGNVPKADQFVQVASTQNNSADRRTIDDDQTEVVMQQMQLVGHFPVTSTTPTPTLSNTVSSMSEYKVVGIQNVDQASNLNFEQLQLNGSGGGQGIPIINTNLIPDEINQQLFQVPIQVISQTTNQPVKYVLAMTVGDAEDKKAETVKTKELDAIRPDDLLEPQRASTPKVFHDDGRFNFDTTILAGNLNQEEVKLINTQRKGHDKENRSSLTEHKETATTEEETEITNPFESTQGSETVHNNSYCKNWVSKNTPVVGGSGNGTFLDQPQLAQNDSNVQQDTCDSKLLNITSISRNVPVAKSVGNFKKPKVTQVKRNLPKQNETQSSNM